MHALLAGLAATIAVACAQSPLTTTFAHNNAGSVGGGLYFNLSAVAPIAVVGLDLNFLSAAGTVGTIEVFTCPTTRIGNQTNPAAWTMVGSGAATSRGPGVPTPVAITPIALGAGTVGVALRAIGLAHAYSDGFSLYSTLELNVTPGEASDLAFAGPLITMRTVNCNIHYVAGTSSVAWAEPYGAGCIRSFTSLYENFTTAPAFDLSNASVSFVPTGASYVLVPAMARFLAPSAVATAFGLTDESVATMPLPAPFPFVGGTTHALVIHSNGVVAMAPGNVLGREPSVATMLNAPQTAFWSWHDYVPLGPGPLGQVMFEQIGPVAVVTWNGVPDFAVVPGASTWQMQFDASTGVVHIVYGSMSLMGNGHLVGYSPGGSSTDPGNRDLSATLPQGIITGASDLSPLRLRALSRPLVGGNCNLLTTGIPAGTPLGATLFGLVRFTPGIDLTAIGMPGCFQHMDAAASLPFVPPGPGILIGVAIPAALPPGLQTFVQSATFSPALTPLGVIASNGVALTIGNQ